MVNKDTDCKTFTVTGTAQTKTLRCKSIYCQFDAELRWDFFLFFFGRASSLHTQLATHPIDTNPTRYVTSSLASQFATQPVRFRVSLLRSKYTTKSLRYGDNILGFLCLLKTNSSYFLKHSERRVCGLKSQTC